MMDDEITIREAASGDLEAITRVLRQADLLAHDVLAPGTCYWLAEDRAKQAVGCAGLELGKDAVLLRSVAVLPAIRKQGLGARLVDQALSYAASRGYKIVYLFSMRSGGYWQRAGFRKVAPIEVVNALPDAPQVKRFGTMPGKLAAETGWRKELGAGTDL